MTDTNTAAALSAEAELKLFKDLGTSPRDDLRQAAMKWRPGGRAEWSFQQYDGTNIGQWWSRASVSWSPSGPLLVIPATPAPAALEGSSSGEGEMVAVPRWVFTDFLNNQPGWPDTARRYLNAPALQPSSAADAKPVAWTLLFNGDAEVNAATTYTTVDKAQSYADMCGEPKPRVVPLYAQPHPSQQARVSIGRLSALLSTDHLRGDYPLGGLGAVTWNDLRAILAALKPVEG